MRGDLNGDGLQDITDAQLLVQYYAENVLAGNSVTWAELIGKLPSESAGNRELKQAQAALKEFMEAAKSRDGAKLLEVTDLRELIAVQAKTEMSEEDMQKEALEIIGSVDEYQIRSGKIDADMLTRYQESAKEVMADQRAILNDSNATAEQLRNYIKITEILKPVDCFAVFTVSVRNPDKEAVEEELVLKRVSGSWYIDTGMASTLSRYIKKATNAVANTNASSLFKAISSSLTVMDADNYDVILLNGTYILNGSDFADLEKPAALSGVPTQDKLLDILKYYVSVYFSNVTELNRVGFYVKNGVCKFTVIEQKKGEKVTIGTYPGTLTDEQKKTFEDAMDTLKAQYIN